MSSSQSTRVPARQPVPGAPLTGSQVSSPLQNRLSRQRLSPGVNLQRRLASSQVSSVQVVLSLQDGGVPATQPSARAPAVPGAHPSLPLQNTVSSQRVSWGTDAQR